MAVALGMPPAPVLWYFREACAPGCGIGLAYWAPQRGQLQLEPEHFRAGDADSAVFGMPGNKYKARAGLPEPAFARLAIAAGIARQGIVM